MIDFLLITIYSAAGRSLAKMFYYFFPFYPLFSSDRNRIFL